MKRGRTNQKRLKAAAALATVTLLAMTTMILADSGGDYTLSPWVINFGDAASNDAHSNGTAYTLSGTVSQPDVWAQMSGGQFALKGVAGAQDNASANPPVNGQKVYLPVIASD
jgi:hypothetical protein